MRKVVSIVVASMAFFFLSFTSSMAEFQAGISGSVSAFKASGSETEGTEVNTDEEHGQFQYPSIFLEYNAGRVSIGLDLIPGAVESEETARTDYNVTTGGTGAAESGNDGGLTGLTNTVKVEISRHVTLYALVPIMDIGAFARIAVMRADVKTRENLGTGSTYPDTSLEGASLSLGYQHDTDGFFARAEVGYTNYATMKVTSSNSHIVEASVDGSWARISIGRTF